MSHKVLRSRPRRRRPRPRIRPRGGLEYWSTAPSPNCTRVAGRDAEGSSRQSLIPVDPILPGNPFTLRSAKTVSSDQQDQAMTDRMKADADPGGIKTERRDHPQPKNDADNQIQLGPRPER
jgi:hypothetical protein